MQISPQRCSVLLVLGILAGATSVGAQAPPNDTCATAEPVMVPGQPFSTMFATTSGTTLAPDCDPGPAADDQIYSDVWYCWTAPATELARITVFPLFDSVRFAVYEDCACPASSADAIVCGETPGGGPPGAPGFPVEELFPVVAGQSYLIRIGGIDAVSQPDGDFLIDTIGPVGSDDCATAQTTSLGSVTDFNNLVATTDGADLSGFCAIGAGVDNQIYDDLWFCWTAPDDGPYRIEYVSTTNPMRIAVYDGCACPAPSSSALLCGEATGGIGLSNFTATGGSTYLIRVGSATTGQSVEGNFLISSNVPPVQGMNCDDSTPGEILVTWTLGGTYASLELSLNGTVIQTLSGTDTSYLDTIPAGFLGNRTFTVRGISASGLASAPRSCSIVVGAVSNDDCDTALPVTAGTFDFNTTTADDGPMPFLFCAMPPDDFIVQDIWFRYVAPTSTTVTFSLCGSSFDTILVLYEDNGFCLPDPLPELACSFDDCGSGESTIDFDVIAGTAYYLRVGGAIGPMAGAPSGEGTLLIDDGTSAAEVFDRGDCNDDGGFNIADPIALLGFLFPSGVPVPPGCDDACDANDDGSLNIADAIAMLGNLFPSGAQLVIPEPHGNCGEDPTADSLDCETIATCP